MAKQPLAKITGITSAQASKELGVSRTHIAYLVKQGLLRGELVLGRLLISQDSVTAYAQHPGRRKRKRRVGRPRKK